MKRKKYLKLLSLLVVMSTLIFLGCSSNDDEPDNSGLTTDSLSSIPYRDLSGTWLIESLKESDSGKVININKTVTINKFEPVQSSDNIISSISNNLQTWAHNYDDLVSYSFDDEEKTSFATVAFVKDENKTLNSSAVFSIAFSVTTKQSDLLLIESFVLSSFNISEKGMVAKVSSYAHAYDGTVTSYVGAITMKKI